MKKLITIISLFVTLCVSAQAQTLFNFSEPNGTTNPGISNLSYSNSLGGIVVTGSYSGMHMFYPSSTQIDNLANIVLVKPDGSTDNLSGGIPDGPIIAHLETSDGVNWAITPHSLWKFENSNWYHVPLTVDDSIKTLFDGGNGNLILIGNFTNVSSTMCQNIVRFNQTTETLDTVGFGTGLPDVLFDPGNFVSTTKSDSSIYFTWNTGMEGTLWKYSIFTGKLEQIPFPYQINYVRVIEFSSSTNSLYCFTVAAGRYLLKLSSDNQWTQVLLFDQDVFSITARNNELYMSGFFTSVNGQSISTSVKLNEVGSNFTPWNTSIIASIYKTVFFPNGNMLGLTSWELVSSFEITSVEPVEIGSLKIYPNPAQIFCIIEGISTGENVILTDILGNILATKTSSTEKIIFDTQHLTSGMYFLKGKNFTQKLLVN